MWHNPQKNNFSQTTNKKSLSSVAKFAKNMKDNIKKFFKFCLTKLIQAYNFLHSKITADAIRWIKFFAYSIFLIVTCVLVIHGATTTYNIMTTKKFEKKINELSQMSVNTITVPPISKDDIENLAPVSNSSSIYYNQNFYMFQLTRPIKSTGEDMENYSVSVYINKPNNILEFFMKDWYGNIITDKYTIDISLRETQKEHNLDVLMLNKKEEIERLDDYIISNTVFQSYKVSTDSQTKYYLISELEDSICLVYSISHNKTEDIPNFNYLSHIISIQY